MSKSGENTLHGSVYWGNTNSITYARSFYSSEKPSFVNYNMFNINNGGPVYIPGLLTDAIRPFTFLTMGGPVTESATGSVRLFRHQPFVRAISQRFSAKSLF